MASARENLNSSSSVPLSEGDESGSTPRSEECTRPFMMYPGQAARTRIFGSILGQVVRCITRRS
jgi:hypothetical protein